MSEELKDGQSEKKCTIYFKMGWLQGKSFRGYRFDRLEACCEVFGKIFSTTGNEKNCSWEVNTLFDEKPGLNLLRRDGEINVFFCGEAIKLCPWSGHAIEVKKSRDVTVQQKMKTVPDGYEEIDLPEGWDA